MHRSSRDITNLKSGRDSPSVADGAYPTRHRCINFHDVVGPTLFSGYNPVQRVASENADNEPMGRCYPSENFRSSHRNVAGLILISIYFEGHATTSDNEASVASGHNDVDLSEAGCVQAAGEKRIRYESIEFDAVFTSDLSRAYKTAELMFEGKDVPIIQDSRLRECDYGDLTQRPREEMEQVRARSILNPFPNGESLEEVMTRMKSFIEDLAKENAYHQILIVGHAGTLWGLENHINGTPLPKLISGEFDDTGKFKL